MHVKKTTLYYDIMNKDNCNLSNMPINFLIIIDFNLEENSHHLAWNQVVGG